MSIHYIYCYTDITNGQQYIGQVVQHREAKRRWEHMNDKTNNYFENHLQAHPENFEYKIIATAPSKNIANELEKMYIRIWKTLKPNGYNIMSGGDGCDSEIMSEIMKQYHKEHPEAAEEQSKKMIKYYEEHPEAREENSERMKKYYEEHPEVKENQREKMIQYYEEHPEAREAASISTSKYFENPENRKNQSKKRKKYFENPENRKANSERQIGLQAGAKNPRAIAVICHTGECFDYQDEAGIWSGLKGKCPGCSIGSAVKGKTKTAGKHPETGEKLKWYRLDSPEGQKIYNKFYN